MVAIEPIMLFATFALTGLMFAAGAFMRPLLFIFTMLAGAILLIPFAAYDGVGSDSLYVVTNSTTGAGFWTDNTQDFTPEFRLIMILIALIIMASGSLVQFWLLS